MARQLPVAANSKYFPSQKNRQLFERKVGNAVVLIFSLGLTVLKRIISKFHYMKVAPRGGLACLMEGCDQNWIGAESGAVQRQCGTGREREEAAEDGIR